MQRLIRILLDQLGDFILFMAFAQRKTMHGELHHRRQQLQRRRMKLSDAQYEETIARWTERTSQGERPGTEKGEAHGRTIT